MSQHVSIQERSDDALRREAGRNESIAHWGGWAVAAGLVFEVYHAIAFPSGKSIWEHWSPVFADFLVAGGVIAEVHFGRRGTRAQEELQRRSDERVATTNEHAAVAERKAATVRLETEQLRAANLQMEKAIARRELEQNQTGRKLRPFADIAAEVTSMWGNADPEAFTLAGYVRGMLHQFAKWPEAEGIADPSPNDFPEGITVHCTVGYGSGRTVEAADALVAALRENNLDATRSYPLDIPVGSLLVKVGPKPAMEAAMHGPDAPPREGDVGARMYRSFLMPLRALPTGKRDPTDLEPFSYRNPSRR